MVGGGWQWLAVGGWSPLAVGGGWWRLVVGGWWRLAVDGSWQLAVGGWQLAVGGPLGRSLRAVLSKKKKSGPLRTALPWVGLGGGGGWAPLGGLLMLVWGTLVIPSPLMAGPPLMGSIPCRENSPVWATGDTPHVMPVEQGLPWHALATGLARQAVLYVVVVSHRHALPSSSFGVPISPAVLAASLASLPPLSSSSAALSPVPPSAVHVSCLAVLLLPLSIRAR